MKLFAFFILFFAASSYAIGQAKLKAEEIIEKHLSSIAPAEKRSSVTSFIAVGEVRVENITQKSQATIGRILVASEGTKMLLAMRLNAVDYPEERIVFDGQKLDVAQIVGRRTMLGSFIRSNGSILSQGLLGGTLTTSWALLKAAERGNKISIAGNKTIDGKEAYALRFTPKGGGELDITMFFDQQTFQHIRTEYKRTISAAMGLTVDESARQSETREKLTEDFSDFKDHKGMMVPTKYKITYSLTGTKSTSEMRWTSEFLEFGINNRFEPGTFDVIK